LTSNIAQIYDFRKDQSFGSSPIPFLTHLVAHRIHTSLDKIGSFSPKKWVFQKFKFRVKEAFLANDTLFLGSWEAAEAIFRAFWCLGPLGDDFQYLLILTT
jgi:hypothetical protein